MKVEYEACDIRPTGPADVRSVDELVTVSRLATSCLKAARLAGQGAMIGVAVAGSTFCSAADGDACHVRSWVACRHGRVIGFASVVESLDSLSMQELIVSPRERNRGVGGALLCQVLDLAEGFNLPITALVRETDVRGLRWLCDRGFLVGRRGDDGRVAFDKSAFGLDGIDGITLVRPPAESSIVRIAG